VHFLLAWFGVATFDFGTRADFGHVRRFGTLQFSGFLGVNDPFLGAALCPSKSGLMNKHIVKHIDAALTRRLFQDLLE